MLYKLAAEQGYGAAQLKLGFMYGIGKGVELDRLRVHMWLSLAASNGEGQAWPTGDVGGENIHTAPQNFMVLDPMPPRGTIVGFVVPIDASEHLVITSIRRRLQIGAIPYTEAKIRTSQ